MSERLTKLLRTAVLDEGQRDNALAALARADVHAMTVLGNSEPVPTLSVDVMRAMRERHGAEQAMLRERATTAELHARRYRHLYVDEWNMRRDRPEIKMRNAAASEIESVLIIWSDGVGPRGALVGDLYEWVEPIAESTVRRHVLKMLNAGTLVLDREHDGTLFRDDRVGLKSRVS